jgi:hypothetical protein
MDCSISDMERHSARGVDRIGDPVAISLPGNLDDASPLRERNHPRRPPQRTRDQLEIEMPIAEVESWLQAKHVP